jgi:hypothetical protein
MGELLCPTENSFNADTLVWSDVSLSSSSSVVLTIRHPKSNKAGGEKVEVFAFPGHNCCPVKALNRLRTLNTVGSRNLPVFAFSSSRFLCKRTFNATLKELLGPHFPDQAMLGHSFRAGIPSALSAMPDLVTQDEIQAWGRWSSQSYLAYTKHKHLGRRITFNKFVAACKN